MMGGFNTESGGTNVVEMYNPSTNTWTPQPSLPLALSSAVGLSVNGIVYIVGGGDLDNQYSTIYSLTNGNWTKVTSMFYARYSHAAVVCSLQRPSAT